MRLGIIAAAGASDSPTPKVGERDAALVRHRIAMDDMGFRVSLLDPARDLGEQLDALLTQWEDEVEELWFYASCLVALAEDDECFLCMVPEEPDIGDALLDLVSLMAGRYGEAASVVIDARYESTADPADAAMADQVVAAIERAVDAPRTGIGLLAAARPLGAHDERIPSRLTAGLLEAIDSTSEPITSVQAHALALTNTDFGSWPQAAVQAPAARSLLLRPAKAESAPTEVDSEAPPAPAEAEPEPPLPLSEEPPPDEPSASQPQPAPTEQVALPREVEQRSSARPAPPSERREAAIASVPKSKPPKAPLGTPSVIVAADLSDEPAAELAAAEPAAAPPPDEAVEEALAATTPADEAEEEALAAAAQADAAVEQALAAEAQADEAVEEASVAPARADEAEEEALAAAAAPADEAVEEALAAAAPSEEADELAPAAESEPPPPEEPAPEPEPEPPPPEEPAPKPEPEPEPRPPEEPAPKPERDMTPEDHVDRARAVFEAGKLDEALGEYKKALAKLGTFTSPLRAEVYVDIGDLMHKQGKTRLAVSNLDKALAIVPENLRALTALVEIHAEQKSWQALAPAEERFLEQLADPEDRYPYLMEFGDRWLDQASDDQLARQRYEQAHQTYPDRGEPLERLLAIHLEAGEVDDAIRVRERLAGLLEEPELRAEALFELGEYCVFEAHRERQAIAAFEAALRVRPAMTEALEVLATMVADNQEWAELERIYLEVVESLEALGNEQHPETVSDVLRRLALLYRDHLEDPVSALDTLERALGHRPSDLEAHLTAVELAEELGDQPKVLSHLRQAAHVEPLRAQSYHQLFSQAQRFGEVDTAFLAASVSRLLEEPTEAEQAVFDQYRIDDVPRHTRAIRKAAWDWLREENPAHRAVDAIMAAVAPAILRMRVHQREKAGKLTELNERARQDPQKSTISVVRSFAWAARFLSLTPPAIYVNDELEGALVAPFAKHQSTVAGRGVLRNRSLGELAFLVGRHLALRLPEHELVAHLRSVDELSTCFLAALKLVLDDAPASGRLDDASTTLAGLLVKLQTSEEQADLETAVAVFEEHGARVNLVDWIANVERCATRAGYVLCRDLEISARMIRDELEPSLVAPEARVADLAGYAVSEKHLHLIKELGSKIEADD